MIDSFQHKGLRKLFREGDAADVPPPQLKRLRRILAILDNVSSPTEFHGLPGLRPHPLKGQYRGYWSLKVTGNWRVVFRFEADDVVDVDLIDYH